MAKKLVKSDRILWIDLEMTGLLSPVDDLILEVAAIVTDWDFNEVATYRGVVGNKPAAVRERMAINALFWDANPDCRDNLLAQNEIGKSSSKIEAELLDFIGKHFKADTPVLMGGNSIHMDRRFIVAKWPKLDARLYYRMLDVSAWKVVFENKFQKKYAKPDAHRALDDIRGSIAELKYYLTKVK